MVEDLVFELDNGGPIMMYSYKELESVIALAIFIFISLPFAQLNI